MPDWASSSELLVMLVVLGFLIAELISIRRTIARDRRKAREAEGKE
jgi:hypothetical protein